LISALLFFELKQWFLSAEMAQGTVSLSTHSSFEACSSSSVSALKQQ